MRFVDALIVRVLGMGAYTHYVPMWNSIMIPTIAMQTREVGKGFARTTTGSNVHLEMLRK